MNAALHRWLDAEQNFAPEYLDAGLANTLAEPPGGGAYGSHRPMALQALCALGASEAELAAFCASQAPAVQRVPWPALDAAERSLRQRIEAEGAAAVLADLLPERLEHAGSMAFHGLIRTAHAWRSGHLGELALALAWWQQRDQALQPLAVEPVLVDLETWITQLWALPPPAELPQAWISARMLAWERAAGVAPATAALRLQPDCLQQLARWALAAYAASGNFTVLHLVTASRAMAELAPLLPPWACTPALRAFSRHAALGLLASGWRGQTLPAPPALDGDARQATRQSRDAHRIKLVQAALAWQADGIDPVLCQAAIVRTFSH